MPIVPAPHLIQAVIDALEESGASAVLISPTARNPRRFLIQSGQNTFELWVYIWTLTHGGGVRRPANEYRIQLTGVNPPLLLNPTGSTVLLGYEPNLQGFAGFDIYRHRTFSTKSPSIQIPITAVERALQDGFSFVRKTNDEIAIGFRADQFLAYALYARDLHAQGADAPTLELLSRAAALERVETVELEQIDRERGRLITTISKLARDSAFRRKVIVAYEKRCAATRMQLRLIDAAHILPVGAPGSTDDVTNGICLSPTYHRAFDQRLIFLSDDYTMRINPTQERELARLGENEGIELFKANLGKRIYLPTDKDQWPDIRMIQRANRFRGI